ncbi:MAG: hypothetical protein ACFFD4_31645, partial [Candidatus Odinarchaeota archaeon]
MADTVIEQFLPVINVLLGIIGLYLITHRYQMHKDVIEARVKLLELYNDYFSTMNELLNLYFKWAFFKGEKSKDSRDDVLSTTIKLAATENAMHSMFGTLLFPRPSDRKKIDALHETVIRLRFGFIVGIYISYEEIMPALEGWKENKDVEYWLDIAKKGEEGRTELERINNGLFKLAQDSRKVATKIPKFISRASRDTLIYKVRKLLYWIREKVRKLLYWIREKVR